MKFTAIAALLGATAAVQKIDPVEYEFINFISKHGRSYGTKEEYQFRLQLFAQAFKAVERLNASQEHSTYEINKFADLTKEEKAKRNGFIPSGKPAKVIKSSEENDLDPIDWRDLGAVTPVKDQGQCGSCWAFATAEAVEGAEFAAGRKEVSLSEQQMIECAASPFTWDKGCSGGTIRKTMSYYVTRMQLSTDSNYPYTATDTSSCNASLEAKKESNVTSVNYLDPSVMDFKNALAESPIAIAVEADQDAFQYYKSGIISDVKECGQDLDHGVAAVGWGHDEILKDYLIVKNSWGKDWGMDGYVKIALNDENVCGILSEGTQAVSSP